MSKVATAKEEKLGFKELFGDGPVRQEGESALNPDFLGRKTEYADAEKHFIGMVPIGSELDMALRAESAKALAHCEKFELGQIVFYVYYEGSVDTPESRVLGIAVPDSPIKFRFRSYFTFRESPGNFVSEFQRNMVDAGFPIFDPPGLHHFTADATRGKNAELLEKAEAARKELIQKGLTKV